MPNPTVCGCAITAHRTRASAPTGLIPLALLVAALAAGLL